MEEYKEVTALESIGFVVDSVVSYDVELSSCQESTLPSQRYEPSVLCGGGGRIRTHVARQGGRFTVCSD